MDDAWFHSLANTTSSRVTKDRPAQTQRASLLQQTAGEKTEPPADRSHDVQDEDSPWRAGPPQATLLRRAQSWADFYDVVVKANERKEHAEHRRQSFDRARLFRQSHNDKSAVLDFENSFAQLEDRLLDASHADHEAYLRHIQLTDAHLTALLSSTSLALATLSDLSSSFATVASQTATFREQCESLLSEQRRLTELADVIEDNASYYGYLEPLTRRLNAPNAASLVLSHDFPNILRTLDTCIMYMEAHPKHRESSLYRSKYRLLLTRALTLIRHHFTKTLGDIANDISKRIQSGQLKDSTRSALLFAKFRVPAPELKVLGLEIQKRAVPTPEDVDANREPEYSSLLRELFQSFSTTRGRLVLPLVTRKMAELASAQQSGGDVLAFAKAGISFMRGICLDEHELWFEWFETVGALYDFLESLMEPMYDYLRPLTIHETRLEKLCELCAMVQSRYMDVGNESDDDDDEMNGTASGLYTPVSHDRQQVLRKLDFASLVQPALEDAQTRLVFLALAVLRDGIENYKIKPVDLEWPKQVITANGVKKGPVLSGRRNEPSVATLEANGPNDVSIDDAESVMSAAFPTSNGTERREWYPTLTKALWLLRKIYRLVNSTVFDDLAHRIVHSTTASLLTASKALAAKSKAPADAQLFLIIHLLQLKQSIVAFDIEFIPPEVEFDFSSMTSTFWELRDRGNLFNPGSWYRLVSGALGGGLLPKVVENMLDAKAELDGRLRTVINELVNAYANHILSPVSPETIAAETKNKDGDSTLDAVKAVRTVRGLAEKHVPLLRAKLDEWVTDKRVKETLVQAVRDQVVVGYEEFFDLQSEHKAKKLSRKGKAREDEILGPEVFGDAMEKVFAVGLTIGEDNEA
ncbi:hypothetical protein AMS68_006087 [Peltaster fructicola]|uniref:Conserved oligomeric Golgi complex subunit 3 n=1 Tax=Peltaster fructicola TaxID=286661 RepID=A0A6H0Y1N7_9PEZI|nr:hypothetical protein AMS68_006087 [Peltaster fructicola]